MTTPEQQDAPHQRVADSGAQALRRADTADRAKNIVLCSDGTGNSGGKGEGTNVWRLYGAVDTDGHRRDPAIPRQLAFHEDGVGTEDFKLFKLIGGAFGWGLSRNIRQLYALLATNYVPGDRIFMFGFSRGAFTVRSLCGMVCRIGLIDVGHEFNEEEAREVLVDASRIRLFGWLQYRTLRRSVDGFSQPELVERALMAAFRRYRRRHLRQRALFPARVQNALRWLSDKVLPGFNPYPSPDEQTSDETRPPYFHKGVKVRCVGVWDTVGALGLPMDWMRNLLDRIVRISFHSTGLHEKVENAYHALAIDDERHTFHPTLWNEFESDPEKTRIQQVWFAGAHSNVGGGYPKQGMAHVTLYWMMRHARDAGLHLYAEDIARTQRAANVNDKLYDPRSGLGAYYRYRPRNIAALAQANCRAKTARIHASVFERIAVGVQSYAPSNLPPAFEVVDDEGTCLHESWTELVQQHVRERGDGLAALHTRAQSWVRFRVMHYYAMLCVTFAVVAGAADLHFKLRALLFGYLQRSPMSGLVSALHAAGRTALGAASQVDAAAKFGFGFLGPLAATLVQGLCALTGMILPEGLQALLKPALDYLADNPQRFVLTLVLVIVLLWLRGALRDQSEHGFSAFWAGLRGQLRERAAEDLEREAAE
jgi:uncharacterized protein (DUF2235 family)